jgi:hypothetical protein
MRLGWKVFIPITIIWILVLGAVIAAKVSYVTLGLCTIGIVAAYMVFNKRLIGSRAS